MLMENNGLTKWKCIYIILLGKSSVNGDKIRVHFYNPSNIISVVGSQGQRSTAIDGLCDFVLTTTMTKYWVTYTIPKGGNSTRSVIIPRLGLDVTGTGTLTFQWEKLEEGNMATDWTPAPEIMCLLLTWSIISQLRQLHCPVDHGRRQRRHGLMESICGAVR